MPIAEKQSNRVATAPAEAILCHGGFLGVSPMRDGLYVFARTVPIFPPLMG
jgi:hypothetical protein